MTRALPVSAAAVLMAVSLAGCGGYKANEGTVIEHVYVPESDTYMMQCTPVGKTQMCHSVPIHYDACFKVRVEDEKGHRGSWCITTQAAWEQIQLGDQWTATS